MLRGRFGCVRRASEVHVVLLTLVQAPVPGTQVTGAQGQLLSLMLFVAACSGNRSRVQREPVGPQNIYNTLPAVARDR